MGLFFTTDPNQAKLHSNIKLPKLPNHSALGMLVDNLPAIKTWYNNNIKSVFNPSGAQANYNSAEALASRNWSTAEAEKTRLFNSEEARLQREWQTEMSNTAYQRAVEDMKKAGLNPYLAYAQGGASYGTGASASSSTPFSTSAQPFSSATSQNLTSLFGSALTFLGLALRVLK